MNRVSVRNPKSMEKKMLKELFSWLFPKAVNAPTLTVSLEYPSGQKAAIKHGWNNDEIGEARALIGFSKATGLSLEDCESFFSANKNAHFHQKL